MGRIKGGHYTYHLFIDYSLQYSLVHISVFNILEVVWHETRRWRSRLSLNGWDIVMQLGLIWRTNFHLSGFTIWIEVHRILLMYIMKWNFCP
jgi:hypothetical protein